MGNLSTTALENELRNYQQAGTLKLVDDSDDDDDGGERARASAEPDGGGERIRASAEPDE